MRHTFSLLIATMTLAASAAIAQVQDFKHYGNFKHMMQSGETKGQVLLSELPASAGVWGVGALAGLKGEIIQIDGKLLVSLGTDPKGAVLPPKANDAAVLWASAKVTDWDSVKVPTDMTQVQFETFVTQQAASRKLDLTQPFIFRVTGHYAHLIWHVVTGERASGDAPQKSGHGASAASGGHGGHGGHSGHANAQSGMKLFRSPLSAGQLVGVYSGDKLEGMITHPGEKFHLHFIDNDLKVSGHVDQYTVKAGSVLLLPKVGQHTQSTSHSQQTQHTQHMQHMQHTQQASSQPPGHTHQTPYAGFQSREIKALSSQQIDDLKAGKGMTLALPAELNGYPGPSHALELTEPLKLSIEQKKRLQDLFDSMSKEAKAIGLEVIEAERKLDGLFKNKTVNPQNLKEATQASAETQARLRESHLRYHLETVAVLNAEQVAAYNRLRDY